MTKPFAYSKELEEKLARQCELNAQLDLENAKAVDADLSGPEEEREADDRMESAAIVAEDKGAYPADREAEHDRRVNNMSIKKSGRRTTDYSRDCHYGSPFFLADNRRKTDRTAHK